jgi:hypothetical protein
LRLSSGRLGAIALVIARFSIRVAGVHICTAEQVFVELNPVKTRVAFTVTDPHGSRDFPADFDPDAGAMSGEIVVDAASGQSGSPARDKRTTRDILQAERFPEIRFSPSNRRRHGS